MKTRVFSFLQVACVCGVFVASIWGLTDSVMADSQVADRISEEERLGARSDQYSRTFNKAISALVNDDAATFRALLSASTVLSESRGPGAIDVIIRDRFIPFFSDFSSLTQSITTLPTYSAAGESGIAFARSFKTTEGQIKYFVIYLITEGKDKRVVVGNLLLNATEKDLLATKGTNPKSAAKAK
jgi:hypothetical protein